MLLEIGAESVSQIRVYNKIDLVEDETARIERNSHGQIHSVWLSSKTGEGVDLLIDAIQAFFHLEHNVLDIELAPADGRIHALLHQSGQVLSEQVTETGGWLIRVKMQTRIYRQLLKNDSDFARVCTADEEIIRAVSP